MSPLAAFQGCRDRIERAKSHSHAFADAWNSFLDDDPYSTSVLINPNGTGDIRVGHAGGGCPDILSLEFGEMLYQLRAALDSSIYASAICVSGQDPPPEAEKLEFPICNSREQFKNAGWKLGPLDEKRRRMVELVQPYNAPDLDPQLRVLNPHRSLQILHDWARKDRHRKLHIVGSWVSNADPELQLPVGCELEYMMVTYDGLLENDELVASFKLSGYEPGMDIKGNPKVAIDSTINEPPEPCADNDTLSNRVKSMTGWTSSIVDGLERSFEEEPG